MNTLIERSRKNMKNKKGFTLIELIVVIVIIGILAAIAIPRLAGFTDTANASVAEADARTIITAASALYTEGNGAADTYTQEEIEVLTGDLRGTITDDSVAVDASGNVDFTYTIGTDSVAVVDSELPE